MVMHKYTGQNLFVCPIPLRCLYIYISPLYSPIPVPGEGPLISHTIGDRVTSFYPTDYSREEPFTHTQNRYLFICFYYYFCITSVLPCEHHRPRKIDPNTIAQNIARPGRDLNRPATHSLYLSTPFMDHFVPRNNSCDGTFFVKKSEKNLKT